MLKINLRLLLLQAALACCLLAYGQTTPYVWDWAEEAHTGNSEFAQDIAVDPLNGDVVVVGEFTGDISAFFGTQFVAAAGGGFVARYTSTGTLLWAFRIGENDNDRCKGVAIDGAGNIYVTGYQTINCDFKGNSSGSTILTSVGGRDVFLAKYDQAGLLQWVRNGGGSNNDEGASVAVSGNSVYITGFYHNTASFGALTSFAGVNQENIFLVAYNATTGNEIWLADAGCNNDGIGTDVIADMNNVFISGTYRGNLTMFDASGTLVATPPFNNSDEAFAASFTSAGAFNWFSHISGAGVSVCNSLTLFAGDIYITGSIDNITTFTGYTANPIIPSILDDEFFLARINGITGNTDWVTCESGNQEQSGTQITSDGSNILVCGNVKGTMTFATGPTITSVGNDDLFVARYLTNGSFDWVQVATGSNEQLVNGIACASTQQIFVCGEYHNVSDFGSFSLPSDGSANIFTARLVCPPITNNTISSAQTICSGNTPAPLTGSVPSGGNPVYIYSWEESPDNIAWSPAFGTNNLQNYSPPALTANTYYRRNVASSGGCLSTDVSASVLISVDALPTVSNAGSNQTICASSTTLAGNPPLSGTGTWSIISGTGTITTPSSENSSVTGMSSGSNVFQWTISSGVCPSSSSSVTINVDAVPTVANAGIDQIICASSTSFNGNTAIIGNGIWSLVTGSGVPSVPASENSPVTGLAIGVNSFQWEITNGTCPASRDTVVINVDAMPTAAAAGVDQTLCASASAFTGNTPLVGNGMWTLVSGSGSPTTPNSGNSTVTGLAIGANSFQWEITNGTCPVSRDTVVINIDAMPTTANAGADQTLCSSSAVFAANTPLVGSGMWTLISGGGSPSSPSLENSAVTSLSVGANSFQWLISNGTCPSSLDTVVINVDAMPTPSVAGTDQTLCASSTAFAGNTPLIGSGLWTLLSGGGTATTPTSETSGVTGLGIGTNVFEWSISNGTCPSSFDTVLIIVDAFPTTANAGTDQTICSSASVFTANTPVSGTGLWTLLSGAGTPASPTFENSNVNGLAVGANYFQWMISNGTCPSSMDTVMIVVDATPTVAVAGVDQVICSSTTTLAANPVVTGSGIWTLLSGSGTITNAASEISGITAMLPGANIFVWQISNGVCPASTDTVVINVDAMPTIASAGSDQTICSPNTTFTGNIATTGSGWWTLLSGTGTISSPSSSTSGVTSMLPGQNIFEWMITNGTCPSSADTVTINVDAMPTVASSGADQTLCSTSATLNGNTPIIGNGIWSLVSGTGTVSIPTSGASGVTGLGVGANVFSWTISNGTCPSSFDLVTVTVDAMPTPANAGPDQNICTSWSVMNANAPSVGIPTWTLLSGTGVVTTPMSEGSSVNGLSPGANIFQWFIGNGTCPASTDTVVINVENPPSIADAGPDQTVDHPFFILQGNAPVYGNGMWEVVSGSITIPNPTDPNCSMSDMLPGIYVFRWVISGTVCDSTTDDVTITVKEFIIPNGFSPNQDGMNDYFVIPGVGYWDTFNLNIYNRWGQLVYTNTDYQNEWNGQNQNGEVLIDDTYYYTVEITEVGSFTGFVVIKRE